MPVQRKARNSAGGQFLSITELENVKQASKKKHGTAPKTLSSYNGYIQHAKEWLSNLTAGVANQNTFDCPRGSVESGQTTTWKWTPLDLVNAFELIPTRASPWAVASFITFKCFEGGLGASTADGIQAAFKHHWDNSDSENSYRGEWKWDEEKNRGYGNPACSVEVMDTVHAVKKKHGAESQRSHSSAMSLNFLNHIYQWSLKFVPANAVLPDVLSLTSEQRLLLHKHLGWRAFSSFSWTLWTRNFEALQMQYRHFTFNCVTNDEFQIPHWRVSLEQRKNWQNKLGKEQELRGHLYEIYPQPDLPAADLNFHMHNWISYLEHAYGCALLPTDFIFPSIGNNGIIQPQTSMSHDLIQKWIDEFVKGAGIDPSEARLTTHCFRRGGAQYRFMYAPVGRRWTLATIRWWGGWAEGEHRDTLIRYLLDELHYYEEGHGDALRPIKTENHLSFMGEHRDQQLVTLSDMKTIFASMQEAITTRVITDMGSVITNVLSGDSRLSDVLNILRSEEFNQTIAPRSQNTVARKGEHPFFLDSHQAPAAVPSTADATATRVSQSESSDAFPPGLCLPNVLPSVPLAERWKVFILQWDFANPLIGQHFALKDWEPDWIRHPAFAMKYNQRKLIVVEFENCGRDEHTFLGKWPAAARGIAPLVNAICQARIAKGEAKARQRKNSKKTISGSNISL